MAKNAISTKSTNKRAKAAGNNNDTELVEEAYKTAFKQYMAVFLDAWHRDQQQAENHLIAGVTTLRGARDRALQLV